jgi:SH3-like domain-containing protein
MNRGALLFWSVLLAAFLASAGVRADDVLPLPRWASLSVDKVYLRQGPTYQNRILWVYHRKGLPVKITGQFDVWRKVLMPDGTVGWIHVAMLSSDRTVVVTGQRNAPVRTGEAPSSPVLALAQPGVVAKLDHCEGEACEIRADGTDGWIDADRIWGNGDP